MKNEKSDVTIDQLLDENNGDSQLVFKLAKSTEDITIDDIRKLVKTLPGRSPAILDKYLAREIIKYFTTVLIAVVGIYLAVDFFKK